MLNEHFLIFEYMENLWLLIVLIDNAFYNQSTINGVINVIIWTTLIRKNFNVFVCKWTTTDLYVATFLSKYL